MDQTLFDQILGLNDKLVELANAYDEYKENLKNQRNIIKDKPNTIKDKPNTQVEKPLDKNDFLFPPIKEEETTFENSFLPPPPKSTNKIKTKKDNTPILKNEETHTQINTGKDDFFKDIFSTQPNMLQTDFNLNFNQTQINNPKNTTPELNNTGKENPPLSTNETNTQTNLGKDDFFKDLFSTQPKKRRK